MPKSYSSIAALRNNLNKKKLDKSKGEINETVISLLWENSLRDPKANCMFVWTLPPDATRIKHSLAALNFSSKLHSVVKKKIKIVLPEENKLEDNFNTISSKYR